ncbi:MAG: insulinase family protein [Spirochaetales bacterium]|nr:insulinase family protein [Spirochaetales bacterium]
MMRKQISRVFAILYLATLLVPMALSARAQSEDLIPEDPAVITGTLDNGLQYYVRSNPKPEGRAELRLAVRAGSIQEDEDQRGLAHFVEHMLFNGTEQFPKNQLIDVLESMGMDFGPDINAYTSFDETVYKLFVRTDDQEQFRQGMDVLHQWASGALLTEEEFEKERGVIYEEYRRGRGAQARMFDASFPILFQGSRYSKRLPIGLPEIILEAPVDALRRYYTQWYRPDLMGIIAVGDFDAQEVENLIKTTFSSMSSKAIEPQEPKEWPVPSHEETLVSIVDDPEAVNTTVEVYNKFTPKKVRFRPDMKEGLTENLMQRMLNQRLDEVVRNPQPPFLYGYAFTSSWAKTTSLNGLVAATPDGEVLQGLEGLLVEIERVQRYGFHESELQRAKANLASSFETFWKDREKMESSVFIQPILDSFLDGAPNPSIDWQWTAIQEYLPQIGMTEINALIKERLSQENRVILISGPEGTGLQSITKEEVLQRVSSISEKEIEPWEDESLDAPLVQNIPQPGLLEQSTTLEETDILHWTLSNGAEVYLKPTDFQDDEILFKAWSPGGTSKVEDEDWISALLSTQAVNQSGLGEFSADALRKALAGQNVGISPYISSRSEGFSGRSVPEDLETLLQIHYLYMTAPRKDSEAWSSYTTRLREFLSNRDSNPQTLYNDLFVQTLYNNHYRSRPLTTERVDEASLSQALSIFQDRFNGADDFTYFFVGSFDPDEIRPLVEQWIGGLPAGRQQEEPIDRMIRYTPGVHEKVLEAGIEPLGVVNQTWTGEWSGTWEDRYAIQSLAAALEMRLLRSIREESSGTYSISARPALDLYPQPQYRISVQFTCDPERVDELIESVKKDVEYFQSQIPDSKYSEDVAESQKREFEENLKRNNWWMNQMEFAIETGTSFKTLMNRKELYDSLTPNLLMDSATKFFNKEHYIQVILMPEK